MSFSVSLLFTLLFLIGSSFSSSSSSSDGPLLLRLKRGAAYAGGHGDFSGVAKLGTHAALGTFGGAIGHGSKGDTSSGYSSAGGTGAGLSIFGALGTYGGYLGHKGPVVISSGGFGNGGFLFGKV